MTTIIVYTSGPAAVRTASNAGWHRIDLDLVAWTDAERDALAAAIIDTDRGPKLAARYTNTLTGAALVAADGLPRDCEAVEIAPPTPDRVLEIVRKSVAAVAAALAERAARDAAAAADRESERQRQLVCPIADLLTLHRGDLWRDDLDRRVDRWRYVGPDERGDLGNAECEARNAALAAQEDREAAEIIARKAAAHAQLREIVATHGADLLPIFDELPSRVSADEIEEAVVRWACEVIGAPQEVIGAAGRDYDGPIDRHLYDALRHMEAAIAPLVPLCERVAATTVRVGDDEDPSDAIEIAIDLAALPRTIYMTIELEHVREIGKAER